MLCNCCAICRRSSSLARGLSCSCTSYTNCCKDISWLGPFIFLHEGSVEIIFSHRWVIGGQVLKKAEKTPTCNYCAENSLFFSSLNRGCGVCVLIHKWHTCTSEESPCDGLLLFHLVCTCEKINLVLKYNSRNRWAFI